MEVIVKKTKLDDSSTSHDGVKSLMYEALKQPEYDEKSKDSFKTELAGIDCNMGFAQMARGEPSVPELTDTNFGKSPVSSYLSYQTSFTASNFPAEADLTAVPRNDNALTNMANYPRSPLTNDVDMIVRRALNDAEKSLANLTVDEDKIHAIESSTCDQAGCTEWKEECQYRFTASSFQLIAKRKEIMQIFHHQSCIPSPSHQSMWHMALSMNP